MSPDSEYISLIMYAITVEIDLCNFPAIWAVLSILLDTQSNTLQYVKSLQQAVNNYYDKCPTDFMSRLEHQASDIMKAMYDSINNDILIAFQVMLIEFQVWLIMIMTQMTMTKMNM